MLLDESTSETNPKQSVRFPLVTLGVVLACVAGIAAMFAIGPHWDRAFANVGVLVFAFTAFISVVAWLTFKSPLPPIVGLSPLIALLVAAGVFFVLFEFIGISGTWITRFRYRNAPAPDEVLADELERASGDIDLKTETKADYWRFLGPSRNQTLTGIHLGSDWNAQRPREIWRQPCGAGWSSFATRNGFAVTLEQRGPNELVTCYELSSGKMQWWHGVKSRHKTFEGGLGPYSTPTIHDGRVYALGATGVLRCLNGANGKLIWQRNLLHEFGIADSEEDGKEIKWGRAASPLIVDNVVIVPAGGPSGGPFKSLVAYDKNDGKLAWTSGDKQVSYASPTLATIADVRQVVIVNEDTVTGHRLDREGETREVLWSYPWPGNSSVAANVAQPVVFPDGRVLLSKAYGQGAELFQVSMNSEGKFTTTRIWKNESVLKTKHTNVVIHEGYIYGLSDGILECVSLDSGERQWKRGRYEHGQILLADDVILVQTEAGDVLLVQPNPKRLVELARFPALSGQTWNNPCLNGRYLVVRNGEEAACYELPLKDGP